MKALFNRLRAWLRAVANVAQTKTTVEGLTTVLQYCADCGVMMWGGQGTRSKLVEKSGKQQFVCSFCAQRYTDQLKRHKAR